MEVLQMRVYLVEIAESAHFAVLMRKRFLEMMEHPENRQLTSVWMTLQAALISYGSVSRFLFPPKNEATAKMRGEQLRLELDVSVNSPLKNRDARNAVEHFDERLDRCLERPDAGIMQMVFQNRSSYEYLNPDRWIVRRAYIVDEDIFITEGKTVGSRVEMPLGEIFAELDRVHAITEELLMTKYRMY